VDGGYVLTGKREVGFALGEYDREKPLVIDPVLAHATLLGGAAGTTDAATDIAVDAGGNAYVCGLTESRDFPTKNALKGRYDALYGHAFVTKLTPDGGALVYSTFFGGTRGDSAEALAIDATGAVYLAGSTGSPDFPTKNPIQAKLSGGEGDAFVARLSPNGDSLVYSTYLGGTGIDFSGSDLPVDLQLDAENAAHVVGITQAAKNDFPLVSPTQAVYGGGASDGFLSIVDPSGARLRFSTYFGGDGAERIYSGVVLRNGDVAAVGHTESSNFVPGFRGSSGNEGAFVSRFNKNTVPAERRPRRGADEPYMSVNGNFNLSSKWLYPSLHYASWRLGEEGLHLLGAACVSSPPSAPCQNGLYLFALNADLRTQNASSLGSVRSFLDEAVMDARGAIYTATHAGRGLPTLDPLQAVPGGQSDVYLAGYAPAANGVYQPTFATYLGGAGFETPSALAVDPRGDLYVTGIATLSPDFRTTPGAFQREFKGRNETFIVKISAIRPASP
jgi:hypothetical protein